MKRGMTVAWCSLALAVAGCGGGRSDGATSTPPTSRADAATAGDAPVADQALSEDAADGGTADAIYNGVVLAMASTGIDGGSYSVYADIQPAFPRALSACAGDRPTTMGCCCQFGIATPWPDPPPSAGVITVETAAGAALATMSPFAVEVDGDVFSTTFAGTNELGGIWSAWPGGYPMTAAQPWAQGDTLTFAAAGAEVPSFSLPVRTGAPLADLTPSLLVSSLTIDRTQDLIFSWTPDTLGGQTVLLELSVASSDQFGTCFCSADDAAGTISVPATVLATFNPGPQQLSIAFERLLATPVRAGKADLLLITGIQQSASATLP